MNIVLKIRLNINTVVVLGEAQEKLSFEAMLALKNM
jgi:predicted component of type VI protein secretion system